MNNIFHCFSPLKYTHTLSRSFSLSLDAHHPFNKIYRIYFADNNFLKNKNKSNKNSHPYLVQGDLGTEVGKSEGESFV